MYNTLVDNSIYMYKILADILVDNMNGPVDNLLVKKKKIYLQAQLRGDLSNVQPVSQQCDGHVLTTTAADNSSL